MSRLDQSRSIDRPDDSHREDEWLPSEAATELLGIKAATLYTYVSRGLVRRIPAPDRRGSLYARADLLRLKDRRASRGGHRAVAADSMRWGQPVIDTEVGGVDGGGTGGPYASRGPIYRGRYALDLVAERVRFERVVDLLLGEGGTGDAGDWELFGHGSLRERRGAASGSQVDRMLGAVVAAGADDEHRHVPGRDGERARRILRVLASCVSGVERARRPELDRALVLVADHGLNASTFAARVAASTGADLYACVAAALAAFSGPRHGGAGARVEALLAECRRSSAAAALRERLARGEALPGFGHPLYPDGDPRCPPLLELADGLAPEDEVVRAAMDLAEAARDASYEAPNLDLGLVAAAAALGLGAGGSVGLFALGRAAGWMAHALEQQRAGYLLRPRARYVGPSVR